MKKRVALSILAVLAVLLTSCISPGMSDFYEEWLTPEDVSEYCILNEGGEPKVYYSTDLDSDIYYLRSNYYWILGESSYNGPADEDLVNQIKDLCKDKGASIGIYSYQYTDTRSGVTGYGKYISSYSIKRYDYSIYLFAPLRDSLILYFARIGLSYKDMDSSERLSTHRNTGAYVTTVYEGSPAYYANISRGDVIISINGQAVLGSSDLDSILDGSSGSDDLYITFVRNGIERTVSLKPSF